MTRFYHHQHMHIVSVSGEGAAEFLNDLLTAQIKRLEYRNSTYGLSA